MPTAPTKVALEIAAIAISFLACSCSKTSGFDQSYKTAKDNAATGAGADYDRRLGAQLNNIRSLPRALSVCVGGDVSQTSVHGYFEIQSSTDYKLILEPKGKLADCASKTYESHALPTPPYTPYLSPFEFTISP
jgi:hypothetical protein